MYILGGGGFSIGCKVDGGCSALCSTGVQTFNVFRISPGGLQNCGVAQTGCLMRNGACGEE